MAKLLLLRVSFTASAVFIQISFSTTAKIVYTRDGKSFSCQLYQAEFFIVSRLHLSTLLSFTRQIFSYTIPFYIIALSIWSRVIYLIQIYDGYVKHNVVCYKYCYFYLWALFTALQIAVIIGLIAVIGYLSHFIGM